MTKVELFDLIQDNWLSWKKKQQLKAAVDEYSSALLRQTDCSMLREIVAQEYNRLRDIANQYEGTPNYQKWAYRSMAVRDVLKMIDERLPVA